MAADADTDSDTDSCADSDTDSCADSDVEPDYRFTLANERTFLAWVRTSLALLAGGIALDEIGDFSNPATRTGLAVSAVGLSLVLAVASYLRWRQVQQAMRRGLPLPHPWALPVLAVVVVAVAGVVGLALVVP
jgi:putative membrane protein